MAERPQVDQGVRLLDPPQGTDPGEFWDRVIALRRTGMPWYNASRVARQEALGVREVDGPLHRRRPVRPIRNAQKERLDREGNVIPNPMPQPKN